MPEDHEQLAKELAEESDRLARESAQLGDEIDQVRSDWRRKQQDPAVPGASQADNEVGREPDGDEADGDEADGAPENGADNEPDDEAGDGEESPASGA